MKCALLFVVAVASAGPLSAKLELGLIPQYKDDCNAEYANFDTKFAVHDSAVYGARDQNVNRQELFCRTLSSVTAHNKLAMAGNSSYSQKINVFADWTDEEISHLTDSIPNDATDSPLYETPTQYTIPAATTYTDFRSKMPPIKNQGHCGSCWAFSAIDVVDFLYGKSHSEQQLLDCSGEGSCNGGNHESALKWLASHGATTERNYPYKGTDGTCKKFSGGDEVSNVKSVSATDAALASASSKRVVSISITIDKGSNRDFHNYHAGIFDGKCQSSEGGGHAIATVGVQKDYFIVRNSWGTSFGIEGYVYMKRGDNVCNMYHHSTTAEKASGSDDDGPSPTPSTPGPAPSGCVDTPNWDNGSGRNCEWYAENRCSDGHYNGSTAVSKRNYPNKNCCACGKAGR
jgi:hypothetical protein